MKRIVGIAVVVVLVILVAVMVLRRGAEAPTEVASQSGISDGRYTNDSLGVILVQVPQRRGWQMRLGPGMPGAPVLIARTDDETAQWELYVTPADKVDGLSDVISRRRDQLASLFSVSDLDQVVGRVLNEDVRDRDGFPAVQWQAITQPVDVAGGDPIHVLFMWVATLRENYAYEGVGTLQVPANPAQRQAITDSLLNDMAFMLESMQFD